MPSVIGLTIIDPESDHLPREPEKPTIDKQSPAYVPRYDVVQVNYASIPKPDQEIFDGIRSGAPIGSDFLTGDGCGTFGERYCNSCYYSYFDVFGSECKTKGKRKVENCLLYKQVIGCIRCDFGFNLVETNLRIQSKNKNKCVPNEVEHCKVELDGSCLVRLWYSESAYILSNSLFCIPMRVIMISLLAAPI